MFQLVATKPHPLPCQFYDQHGRWKVVGGKRRARLTYAVGVHLRVGLAVGDLHGPQANTQGKDIV